ncbi:MAG: cysteine rich repeat-containing protein [Gammaproteobacteria bacterium]|nr:cysteine rich repeat-containing protein [Gammaproteobacteria bacterium]
MKKLICVFGWVWLLGLSGALSAAEPLVDSVAKGCEKELKSYCSNVTPGEGRVLACIYAHNDKLSNQCEYALYDAAVQLERAVQTLVYVVNECEADIEKHCSTTTPGQGRIAACLEKNASKVSKRCNQALKDVSAK